MTNDRARGCILALAAGDALGAPLEFKDRDSQPELRDMKAGGAFKLEAGVWTDDTSMALCLGESLVAYPEFNHHDLMGRFLNWYQHGYNSATGRCFDIGGTTKAALLYYRMTRAIAGSSVLDEWNAGNGSLMRLAPVAVVFRSDVERAKKVAVAQSLTTHASQLAADACSYMATLLVEALQGADREQVLAPREIEASAPIADIARGSWRTKSRAEIKSSGYVVDTLEAALWAVGTTDTLEDALILAANLGDDADTVAAVAGQLAGALYGESAIPERWMNKLFDLPRLSEFADSLIESKID